jgi:fermentation-respiration switch protein FrsA (DUF1100 family)
MSGTFVPALLAAAVLYAALALYVYLRQAQLLYRPEIFRRSHGPTPGAIHLPFEDLRIHTPDGVSLHAWLVPASEGRPVVLFCHGNGGNIQDCLGTIRILHELDLHLLIFDYRGYGDSSGRPSEGGTYRDVQAVWRYLVGERGFAPGEIILFGRSLGAAVAAHLARDVRPGALILESPFISLPEIAAHHYWYLPVRQLVRYRYSTVDFVEAVEAPTLVIHSADDEVVPIEHGRRVFDHARGPKRFLLILGAHADGFITSGTRYTQGLRRFLEWAFDEPAAAGTSGPAISP